jgi:deazaflavin-dependent oxidoreductase (nitroreductase family)
LWTTETNAVPVDNAHQWQPAESVRDHGSMNVKDELSRSVTLMHRSLFNASKGRIGGRALGMPVLQLTTTGRTSGKPRPTMLTSPLVLGDKVMLVASNGGDDREPSWCQNLRKTPEVEVTMEGSTRRMRAHIADSDERAELWPQITSAHSNYAGYQRKTDREIPVVVCEPIS